ncbi:unnamed protein product [Moneuplotes crassus]|uniref:DUF962 domain-containing protein n=1 Tax=Euplotes crassus TaxID=5936 RepID=A0AAD1Y030_EUPCR|nr:unnamed protein product [Moneuplotes crassus]
MFKKLYVSYGVYHANNINKMLHAVFIPAMMFFGFSISQHFPICDINIMYDKLDVGLILVTIIPILYLLIEPVVGVVSFLFYQILYDLSIVLYHMQSHRIFLLNKHFQYCIIGFLFCNGMIFIGHKFFEVRPPNPIANFKYLIFEPAVVVFEILSFLGYRSDIAEWRELSNDINAKYLEEKEQAMDNKKEN